MPEWKPEIRRRLVGVKIEPMREAAIVEELSQYLDDCYEELLSGGLAPAEAERRTLEELSESEILTRELRRAKQQTAPEPIVLGSNWRTNMIAGLWQDLRFGARMLLKKPGFALIAVLTLALGIGLNAALFSVVNALILRPLPYSDPARLVQLWQHDRQGVAEAAVSNADFLAWRAQAQSFAHLTAHNVRTAALTTGEGAIEVAGVFVADNFFATLGVPLQLGRAFAPEETQPVQSSLTRGEAAAVVIVSYPFWQSRLGGRADVIGQTLTLDERPHTIVGVLRANYRHPEAFDFRAAEIFLPLPLRTNDHRHALRIIGRLQPGFTVEQAQTEMATIARRLEQTWPQYNTGWGVSLVPLAEQHSSKVRRALLVLQGAVGFVLLITCVNLANLLLARVTTRAKELALRAALGADKWRLIRLFLSESGWLAVLGGLGGLLLARWCVDLLPALAPRELISLGEVNIDGRVLGFTLLLSLLMLFFFSLAPLWQVSRTNLNDVLKDTPGAPRGSGLRSLLVVAEIALTLVLLAGAGLMLRSLSYLHNVPLGFDAGNLLTMQVGLPRSVPDQKVVSIYKQLTDQIATLPGVQSAALTSSVPLSGMRNFRKSFSLVGQPAPATEELPTVGLRFISPNYFRAMRIPLITGRSFTEADTATAPNVAIVNEAFVRRYLAGLAPLGQQLLDGERRDEIVGVVSDFKYGNLHTEAAPEIFIPHSQNGFAGMTLVVRTQAPPENLTAAVQHAVWQVEKNAVVARTMAMKELLSEVTARPRFMLWLLGTFALVALLITGVGVYGVLAYMVAQSTREFGIRMALGAETGDVLKLVLGKGMALALLGAGIGLAGAFALTRWLNTLLFGVSATDPLTFAAMVLLLLSVALFACWIPARRATKVDPMIALRTE
jgi:putative ABC transport system permease protein